MKLNKFWNQYTDYNKFIQDFQSGFKKPLNIIGLDGSALSFFISSLILKRESKRVFLLLTNSLEDAQRCYQDLMSFTGWTENNHILIYPAIEVLPYEDLPYDTHIVKQRIRVLSALLHYRQADRAGKNDSLYPSVIISTYRAVLPKIIQYNKFLKQHLKLQRGGLLNIEFFLTYLLDQGYQSSEMVEVTGQFSQRGGIIDVFPYTEENPLRIELDGEKVASLRFFDLESQRSIKKIEEIELIPQIELNTESMEKEEEIGSLFDYLPDETNIFVTQFPEMERNIQDWEKEIKKSYLLKKEEKGELLPPDYYYLSWLELKKLLAQKERLVTIESWLTPDSLSSAQIRDKDIDSHYAYQLEINPAEQYLGNIDLFLKALRKSSREKQNILILANNKVRALRLAEIFDDRGFSNFRMSALPEVELEPGQVCLSYGQMSNGFSIPVLNLAVITEQEIFGRQREKSYQPKRSQGKSFFQLDELKPGDYVVHVNHGIGRYEGIRPRITDGVRRDYLLIQYAADDELYVPVEQLSSIHKYIGVGGGIPKLHRLGGNLWRITKRRVKESIQKVALELFELYSRRKSVQGFSFSGDTVWQQELEMTFPFQETPDQEKAFQEVKSDMESPHPMERLICGDVGYGKTEIAIRAAFKAVMDNKQVAVLAPTTILVQQHWENFSERMKGFPVRIEMLSRFKSKKEQQEIIADLKKGNIDIIIGTHRLVQPDVTFKDLGLLVVDEEQRFGVIHKERIKNIKEQVDSLTLTATPIPRTLYLSLTGIREMSVINTPPELRLPIMTFFKTETDEVIREAIRRELERGGQVYYVHNRVEDIDSVAEKIRRLVPEAKVITAHGQMPEEQLENIMIDFINRESDVLVCTTIIEIGLDIPNVNTIIIDQAHQFGLSQLYQLRGRVGRSNRRAYAYLLYPSKKILTDNARKRLEAIREFSDLGSGFRLAMRDLEIRGAGNLLGKEQHGFVTEVGFNYYCQLLGESIGELLHPESAESSLREPEPEIEARLESLIPEYYIRSPEVRISYYQKLGQLKNEVELNDIEQELRDIYGPYPAEVENLLHIIALKLILKNQGVTNIRITPRSLLLKFPVGVPLERKIKKALNNSLEKNISCRQKGHHCELKLTVQRVGNSLPENHILKQSFSFLKNILNRQVQVSASQM